MAGPATAIWHRPWDADYGVASQAEYLDRALTTLRVNQPTIAGVGLGGSVALRLAATRPERVEQTLALARHPIPDELWARLDAVGFDMDDPEAGRWGG